MDSKPENEWIRIVCVRRKTEASDARPICKGRATTADIIGSRSTR
jgi:hypothetical protein